MLLPYPSERKPSTAPLITIVLLLAIVGISSVQIVLSKNGALERGGYAFLLGVVPSRLRPLSFLTYSFIHANVAHLLINILFLWTFGAGVEAAVGRVKLLALYLLGGAFGAGLQVLVALKAPVLLSPSAPIIGASAGCSCLIGLYAVRYYRDRITFVGIPYRPNVVELVTLFLCVECTVGLWEMFVGQASDGVAHWAHIGGFVFGLTCGYLLKLDKAAQTAYWSEDIAAALDKSRPGAAVGKLEQVLARAGKDASAHAELARAWLAFHDVGQAARRYVEAMHLLIEQNRRKDAAYLYREMRDGLPEYTFTEASPPQWTSTLMPELTATELFMIGLALEELDEMGYAADALRAVTVRAPNSTEAETALLKVVNIYTSRLGRAEEARILLRLFVDRYPNSALSARAEEMRLNVQQALGK